MKNILLTGLPRSGKSTLLERLVSSVGRRRGFITREVRKGGRRTGFELIGHDGQKCMLASVDFDTPYRVSSYCVDLEGFEAALDPYFSIRHGELLYLDEIGQMELFSDRFRELVRQYLDSPNMFFGTLSKVYHDRFTDEIRKRADVKVIELDPSGRERVYASIRRLLQEKA
ncbi:AAA family ATPase [Candidatus Woesearchaeota archaeon]|nr:AAA family ATPase [Candidatus Woesearchaeota archaeon]